MPSLPKEAWTDDVREVFAIYEGEVGRRNGSRYNFMHWFANHPDLAQDWLRYNHRLTHGVLDPKLREIIVLRVAHHYKSKYEWGQHVLIGKAIGLGSEHFHALTQPQVGTPWNEREGLVLRAADALLVQHDIDDELWERLRARFDRKELMEILFLVGTYTLLAWVLSTVRMPEEHLEG
jgi:alkylhydroperoxidase family enzyme